MVIVVQQVLVQDQLLRVQEGQCMILLDLEIVVLVEIFHLSLVQQHLLMVEMGQVITSVGSNDVNTGGAMSAPLDSSKTDNGGLLTLTSGSGRVIGGAIILIGGTGGHGYGIILVRHADNLR